MAEPIIVTTFDEAIKLATSKYWIETFFFADTSQGITAEENFNREYHITDRNGSDLVHYTRID